MNDLVRIAMAELVRFLTMHLPAISDDWWEKQVVGHLTFQQQRTVQERDYKRLEQLDLAALLRILDQNWFDLSGRLRMPREGRNWVRELQTARNRWAHASIEESPASEQFRDADTLGRLLNMLEAEDASLATVEKARTAALAAMVPNGSVRKATHEEGQPSAQSAASEAPVSTRSGDALFSVGELVALRSNPDTAMPIIGIVAGAAETRYRVFQHNRQATYYESQLQPFQTTDKPSLLTARDLRAYITSFHLLSPSTANLYSLRSGRVQFVPYQYRPVLRLIRADRPRLLIADEVGV
ncbi:MAG: Swt1 family HEPN domain-containing protein, partial [Rhodospirillaceae bacterium]|nr:Swt1 family HEPN domain-containing protein [Rhodospirillaceae bacterium]